MAKPKTGGVRRTLATSTAPNPPPEPGSGPPPVTGSGRAAFIVPTLGALTKPQPAATAMSHGVGKPVSKPTVAPPVMGRVSTGAAKALPPRAAEASPATIAATIQAAPIAVGRNLEDHGDELPPEPKTPDYGGYGGVDLPPAKPSRATRQRTRDWDDDHEDEQQPVRRGGSKLLVLMLVLLVLAGGGGAAWYFLVFVPSQSLDSGNQGNQGATVTNDNRTTPGNQPTSFQPTVTRFTTTWSTEPPAYSTDKWFRAKLKVQSPTPVQLVRFNGRPFPYGNPFPANFPNRYDFELDVAIDIDEQIANERDNHKFDFVFTDPGAEPVSLRFALGRDREPPRILLEQPSNVRRGDPLIFKSMGEQLVIRITDNNALKRVVVNGISTTFDPPKKEHRIEQTITLPEKTHEFRVEAEDVMGLVERATYQLWVDRTPPVLSFPAHPNQTRWTVEAPAENLQIDVTDVSGPPELVLNEARIGSPTLIGTETYRFTVEARYRPGTNELRIKATDKAGHVTNLVVTVTYAPNIPLTPARLEFDGETMWTRTEGAMPDVFTYTGPKDKLPVYLRFRYAGPDRPGAVIGNQALAPQPETENEYGATAEIKLTGLRTPIRIRLTAGSQNLELSFTVIRSPFPPTVVDLADVGSWTLDKVFPPSGAQDLPLERLAVDFAPLADGVVVVTQGTPSRVVRFNAAGDEQWSKELPGGATADGVRVVADNVLVRTHTGKLLRYDLATGGGPRDLPLESAPGSEWCGVGDDRIAVQRTNGELVVATLDNRESVVFKLPGRPSGPLVTTANGQYVLVGRGGISVISLVYRRVVWSSPAEVGAISIGKAGRWAATNRRGKLLAFLGFKNTAPVAEQALFGATGHVVALPDGTWLVAGPSSAKPDSWQWGVVGDDGTPRGDMVAGPAIDTLRIGPDGAIWVQRLGYVCRLKAK